MLCVRDIGFRSTLLGTGDCPTLDCELHLWLNLGVCYMYMLCMQGVGVFPFVGGLCCVVSD